VWMLEPGRAAALGYVGFQREIRVAARFQHPHLPHGSRPFSPVA